MNNEIFNMIMTKYGKNPFKKEYSRNKWTAEPKTEELGSSEMWQAKQAGMRSKMHKNTNPSATKSKRKKHKLTRVCTDGECRW